MAQPVLVKVYGNAAPVDAAVLPALERAVAVLGADGGDVFSLGGGALALSFEGAFFPLEDVLAALEPGLSGESSGRIDYLDLDEWTMTRCFIEGAEIRVQKRGLNDVLDYSGH